MDSAISPHITDDRVLKKIISSFAKSQGISEINPNNEEEIQIISKDIKIGTNSGDNYLGTIYRAIIKYASGSHPPQDLHLILKTLDYDNPQWTVPAEMKVYEKESFCYTTILPLLNAISLDNKFGPRCFYVQEAPIRMIVMEDLKQQGYQMVDRTVGIDFDHCSLVLKKLASFHAASLRIDRNLMDSFNEGMCTLDVLTDAYRGYLIELVNAVESWNDAEYGEIVAKLKLIRDNHKRVFLIPFSRDSDSFRVLNHGDIWVNNFLYKYENQRPVDVQFLDYQMSFYTSPGYDLNYFLIMNPDFETRLTREADLLEVYRQEFNRKLIELQIPDSDKFHLTPEFLQQIMKEKALYGFNIMLSLLPAIMRETEGTDDTTAMFRDENEKRKIIQKTFKDERFTTYLRFYLKKFDALGTLDLGL